MFSGAGFQFSQGADPTNIVEVIQDQTTIALGVNALTGDTTWGADETIILRDAVYVPSGVTLTIEPGTTIYSSSDPGADAGPEDDAVGAVIVSRGGLIDAPGTPEAPITFTAIEELEVECGADLDGNSVVGPLPTATTSGLWGGVILLGHANAVINDASGNNIGNATIEGFGPNGVDVDGDTRADAQEYGFDSAFPRNDADSSGTMTYVRIQHGGFAFGEGNEINGLTLGGVGSGTVLNHIEIVANSDDGIEFFGGTVNTSNIAVVFCEDDSFDLDNGVAGHHQFWFAIQSPAGDRLGEWDGLNGDLSDVSGASSPAIYNATFVGPGLNVGDNSSAIFIDDAFSGTLQNSIIAEKETNLVDFSNPDGPLGTFGNAGQFTNNTIGNFGNFDNVDPASVLGNAPDTFYANGFVTLDDNTTPGVDPVLFTALERDSSGELLMVDPRPVAESSAVTGPLAALPAECQPADYRGAFAPTGPTWLDGWSFSR